MKLCSLPVIYLGPNYGGSNEDNGNLLQKVLCTHCHTPCPRLCSRPLLTHASTRDSWTLPGKSGSVSFGVTAPFSWVLVHTSFCLCPPRVCFPDPCKFWQLCGGVNGDLLQEGLCHTQICCTQSPCPCGRPVLTRTSSGDTQTSSVSVSVRSLGPRGHRVCLGPPSVSGGMLFDSKCDLALPTVLAGSSPLPLDVGYLLIVAPAPRSCCSSSCTPKLYLLNFVLDVIYTMDIP